MSPATPGDASEPIESWLPVGTPGAAPAPRRPPRPASEVPLDLLEATFESALGELRLAFQPIVVADTLAPFGHEALMRSGHETLSGPSAMLDAAERLHRVDRLGRAIRRKVAAQMRATDGEGLVFVNLHALELLDRSLWSPYSPLGKLRRRIVLEITERASLEVVDDARYRVAELREMGYRIAIDDLGAGHSRMNRFTLRDTDFVKLDMSLVRDLDKHPRRRRLVA
ncbi:MAG TPA: EAL domain-containing protein, partial [Kofleriaceae bacterium]|nr:EAL domain-containing protein [Kofleriaceae bacterium]